jgi:hypothetical protein
MHTHVNAWPSWQPDITGAHIDGVLEPGTSFYWTSYDFPVRSTVYEVTDQRRVVWDGTSGGMTGIPSGCWSKRPDDVLVSRTESFSGDPIDNDRESMQTMRGASLVKWLDHVMTAAEKS